MNFFLCFLLVSMLPAAAGGIGEKLPAKKIAYIIPSHTIDFWINVLAGIEQEAARSDGVEIIVYDSKLDPELQENNARKAVSQGVSGIIISPVDTVSCSVILDIASAAGIPAVICDIGTDRGSYLSFIGTNNRGGASAVGKYMTYRLDERSLPQGEIVIIGISQARANGIDRTQGFLSALDGTAYTFVKLVESLEYTASEAEVDFSRLLTDHPGIVGVFTEHDDATIGVARVLDRKRLTHEVIHVGFDGSPFSVQLIKEGKLSAASMQQPVEMGRQSVRQLVAFYNGKPVARKVVVPTLLVTRENVFEIEPQLIDEVFPQTALSDRK